jgi:hypothetical protein
LRENLKNGKENLEKMSDGNSNPGYINDADVPEIFVLDEKPPLEIEKSDNYLPIVKNNSSVCKMETPGTFKIAKQNFSRII